MSKELRGQLKEKKAASKMWEKGPDHRGRRKE